MINNQSICISLFTGAYGLDLGLEQAGFHTVSVVEKDKDAVKTIALNRPHLQESAIPRELEKVSSQELLEEGGRVLNLGRALLPGQIDLVTGGPPCQPFSTAGKRGSVMDPRGSLFMDFIRIVKEVQPRFFLMENVRGLLSASLRHRPINQRGKDYPALELDEMNGAALKVVLAEMKQLGYNVVYNLLEAADYGVPQNRSRVFFIGSRDGETATFPLAKYSKDGKILPKWRTLKDALTDFVDIEPEFISYSENRLKFLRLLAAGENWKNLPEELQKEAMGGAYNSGGGKVGFYRRLSWDKPSPTITTSPQQKATDMCHPVELRPLTVRESAKIQTFPDDWIFHGSISSKYKQIGNAVPVLLAKELGEYLIYLMQGNQPKGKEVTEQLSLFSLENLLCK